MSEEDSAPPQPDENTTPSISDEDTAEQMITDNLIDDLSRNLLETDEEAIKADDEADDEPIKEDKDIDDKTDSQKDSKQKPSTLFD